MNREEGLVTIQAKAVVLAMGCRERSRGALNIPGFRPAGVYSAGTRSAPDQHGRQESGPGSGDLRLW